MEIRITITDGVVKAETDGRSSTETGGASVTAESGAPLHLASVGLSSGMLAATGAINAGPAPVELSVSGTPMPFITGTQQGAGARSSMETNLPADESGGSAPASVALPSR
jgi:hypothetical protein